MFLQTLIIVISPLVFLGIAWFFMRSRRDLIDEEKLELTRIQMHNEQLKKDELQLQKDIQESRLRGEMILKFSEKIAQDLIKEIEIAIGQTQEEFGTLVPGGEHFEDKLNAVSEKLKSECREKIKVVLSNLDQFEKEKAELVNKFSDAQIKKTEESLTIKRNEELQKLSEKLQKYKEEEIALFDEKVKKIVEEAAIEVLGKALTSEEQEELIMKALAKAREENAL